MTHKLSKGLVTATGTTTPRTLADRFAGSISAKDFGVIADGVTDSSVELQSAIDFAAENNVTLRLQAGTIFQSSTLIIPSGLRMVGEGKKLTIIKKAAGFNGVQLKSEHFDTLTGTDALDSPNIPVSIDLKEFTLDGNYLLNDWKSATNSYVNTSGGGIEMYARYYSMDIDVTNQAGVGMWLEATGTETEFNTRKDSDFNIDCTVCKEECLIYKGPSDARFGYIWTAIGGARIKSEQELPPVPSPTYGGVNGGYTDNLVFDGAAGEVDKIHSWGCLTGRALWIASSCRLNANLIIGESSRYGGVELGNDVYGLISNIDVHGCGGGLDGSVPDLVLSTTDRLIIGSIDIEARGSVDSGQDRVVISGNFIKVGTINVEANGNAGHALKVSGNYIVVGKGMANGCQGTANDGLPSSALVRNAAFSSRMYDINMMAVSCDNAFHSINAPSHENITVTADLLTGATVFSGTVRDVSKAQSWDINGFVNATRVVSSDVVTIGFDPSTTAEQTLVVAHGLIHTPDVRNVQLTVFDTFTSLSGDLGYMLVSTTDTTNITIKLKMNTAAGSNTTPALAVSCHV